MPDKLCLLAVHAHPDDEAIGTGGVLARYAAEGVEVALVCATRGENGEIVDPSLDPEVALPRLGEIREGELRQACAALGVSSLHFLGYRDSGMAGTPENSHPQALVQADPGEAARRLIRLIRQLRPQVVITYNENGGYGHPDHIAVHRITVAAYEDAGNPSYHTEDELPPWQPAKLYYTAFPRSRLLQMRELLRAAGQESPFEDSEMDMEQMTTADELVTTHIDVRGYLPQKMQALRCHRTQLAPDSFFFQLPEEMSRLAMGYEHFVLSRSTASSPAPEDDLFAGLR